MLRCGPNGFEISGAFWVYWFISYTLSSEGYCLRCCRCCFYEQFACFSHSGELQKSGVQDALARSLARHSPIRPSLLNVFPSDSAFVPLFFCKFHRLIIIVGEEKKTINSSNCPEINAAVTGVWSPWQKPDAAFIKSRGALSSFLCKCIHLCDAGIWVRSQSGLQGALLSHFTCFSPADCNQVGFQK